VAWRGWGLWERWPSGFHSSLRGQPGLWVQGWSLVKVGTSSRDTGPGPCLKADMSCTLWDTDVRSALFPAVVTRTVSRPCQRPLVSEVPQLRHTACVFDSGTFLNVPELRGH
jgi:hypothetical protein